MRVIKIDYRSPDGQVIRGAAKVIKKGGIVIVPTDTVYGIFADALNWQTVEKVLKFKKREEDKGFDLTLYPFKKIFEYVQFNPLIPKILRKIPDQPLSFALPRKKSLPEFLNPDYQTVAFHFFFSELDKKLFEYLDSPVIGTSANISELPEVHSVKEVTEYFRHTFGSAIEPDLILDAGKLQNRKPSAIIELNNQDIKVVREGDISKKLLEKELKEINKKSFNDHIRN